MNVAALFANIRLSWKASSWKNALAFIVPCTGRKKKSFITLITGVNVTKLFSSVTDEEIF